MGVVQSKKLQGRKGSGNSGSGNHHPQKLYEDNDTPVTPSTRHQNIVSMLSSSTKPSNGSVSPRRKVYSSSSTLPKKMPMQRFLDDDSNMLMTVKKSRSSTLLPQPPAPLRRAESYIGVESTSRFLPDDWDSQDRDLALHFALKRLLGGNVLPDVQELLRPNATVVDLGCFNGAWLLDMAPQYPNCQFIGIETLTESPVAPPLLSIPNIRIHMASPTAPYVPIADATVDVCYLRAQSLNFRQDDWKHMIDEAFRILKPGGVLQVVEAHYVMEGTVLIESFFHTVHKLLQDENRDVDIALKFDDQLTKAGFQVVNSERKTVHFGSDGRLGEDFIAVSLRAFEQIQGLLADKMGLDDDEYQQRLEMVCAQCVQRDACHHWYAYVARKPVISSGVLLS